MRIQDGTLWADGGPRREFPSLAGDLSTDVLIVGAGVAGLTAALLLARRGRTVTVIDARQVASGETSRTTAHLTDLLDVGYRRLEAKFGAGATAVAAEASRAAIDSIETSCSELAPGARFERVFGYKVAQTDFQLEDLKEELVAMQRAGVRAEWTGQQMPFPSLGAIRLEQQAQLHPGEYTRGLVDGLIGLGVAMFENTRALEFQDGSPCRVKTELGTITAKDVLVLTNVPVSNRFAIHTKVAAYRTYVMAGECKGFPKGLYEDMAKPYHYVRRQETERGNFVIVGGEDHRTGHGGATEERYAALTLFARSTCPGFVPIYRWSGQIIEPSDGLPYIGRNTGDKHVYVATGFSGTGITMGTLAAMLLTAAVEKLESRWAEVFQATRVRPFAQALRYFKENVEFPKRLLRDRVERGEVAFAERVMPGEGRLVRSAGGHMLAVSREADGALQVHSAVCPHLGCHVHWNRAEQSWDCPCHGSRFDAHGEVLNGPATRALRVETLEPREQAKPRIRIEQPERSRSHARQQRASSRPH
jgi:glycine/D-amino acid oxidase-like deaminating enzyme/nitrite reductase/ring-hydroxylating ferredoxin subunit